MPPRPFAVADYRAIATRLERIAERDRLNAATRAQFAETARVLRTMADKLSDDRRNDAELETEALKGEKDTESQ